MFRACRIIQRAWLSCPFVSKTVSCSCTHLLAPWPAAWLASVVYLQGRCKFWCLRTSAQETTKSILWSWVLSKEFIPNAWTHEYCNSSAVGEEQLNVMLYWVETFIVCIVQIWHLLFVHLLVKKKFILSAVVSWSRCFFFYISHCIATHKEFFHTVNTLELLHSFYLGLPEEQRQTKTYFSRAISYKRLKLLMWQIFDPLFR